MNKVDIIPIGDRVVVKPDPQKLKEGDLYLPDQGLEAPVTGTVIAVGPGKNGIGMQCVVGDTVLYSQYSGEQVVVYNTDYRVMRETDIFCILPKPNEQ